MAVRLLIDFQEVRDRGTAINNSAGDIDSTMTDLLSKADPAGIWEGAAAEAYWQLLDQWKTGLTDFTEAMRGLSQLITSFADAMEQGDQETAQKILSGIS